MTQPTITTIIPAYRAAGTIGRALDSVLAQSCPPTEILLVDDGSPDDLAAAVRPYGDRVRLVRKSNAGAASARNLGLDRARGELIAFLDADDYWEAHKLERQLAILHRYPEVGLTCGRWFMQEPGAPRMAPPACTELDFDRVLTATGSLAFSVATKMWTSTILVRRNVVGAHRFTSGLEPAEDRDLWIRLVVAAPIYMSSEPLATYVQEPGSLSRTNVDRDYGNMLRVVRRNSELLGKHGVRCWEAETFRKWASRYLGENRPCHALKPAWNRLLRDPCSPEGWWVILKSMLLAGPSLLRAKAVSS